MLIIGIDPGAKYTGVVVRDTETLEPLLSSTYVRPNEVRPLEWAEQLATRLKIDVLDEYPTAELGIEGVAKPNPYHNGKKSLNSPKWLIDLSILVGGLTLAFIDRNPYIIRPRRNGSQTIDSYPKELCGRRPKTLKGVYDKGAGTRNHEKSAWDVAGEVPISIRNNHHLDAHL